MRHAETVADGLVLDLDLVVGRIDGARRTGRVREADGDAYGARDAGGEVRAVEVRCPLLGGGTALGRGGIVLDDLRPATLASLQVAHGVRDRRHVERGARERVVEPAEIEPETAALRRALVAESRPVDVRTRRDPVHGAVDAEDDRIEEVVFARFRDSRLTVTRRAEPRREGGVHFLVLRLKPGLAPLPVGREGIDAEAHADRVTPSRHVVRPAAEARRVHLEGNRERRLRLVLRHAHVAVDAASEGRKRDPVEVECLRAALRHTRHLRVKRDLAGEARAGVGPECVEVRRRRTPLLDLLRLESRAEHERIVAPFLCGRQGEPQEPGFAQRARELEDAACRRHVERHVREDGRAEVVQDGESPFRSRQVFPLQQPDRERGRLAAAVDAVRPIKIDLVCGGERRPSDHRRKNDDRHFLQKHAFHCWKYSPIIQERG